MELLQLKYFMAVARHQHVTKAAEELFVAQPSISQAISRLEKELGFKLFDRIGKTVQLNQYGKTVLKRAEAIFANLEELHKELRAVESASDNQIRLSMWQSANNILHVVSAFSENYPYISLHVTREKENYDFRFWMLAYETPPEPFDVLLQESVVLAVPHSHALAKFDSVPLSLAKDEPFSLFPATKPFRQVEESYFQLAGFKPIVAYEHENWIAASELIKLGQALCLAPIRSWGNLSSPYVKFLKIETPICIRTIYMSRPKDKVLSGSEQLFRDFVVKYYPEKYN